MPVALQEQHIWTSGNQFDNTVVIRLAADTAILSGTAATDPTLERPPHGGRSCVETSGGRERLQPRRSPRCPFSRHDHAEGSGRDDLAISHSTRGTSPLPTGSRMARSFSEL